MPRRLIREMSLANRCCGVRLASTANCSSSASRSRSRRLPSTWRGAGEGGRDFWKTFLHNHASGIGAMDFLIVLTIGFRLLFVLVILRHERRRLISLSVTAHPTA